MLARVLRQARKDWAALDGGWAQDEYEEIQQRAIHERLGLADVHGLALAHGDSRCGRASRCTQMVPPPRRRLTSFHGVYAPHAALRPLVTQPLPSPPTKKQKAPPGLGHAAPAHLGH